MEEALQNKNLQRRRCCGIQHVIFLLYIYNYAFCSYFMTLQAKIEARIRKYKNIKDFSYKNIKVKI